MNNLNTYTPRMGQMASSSMFFQNNNNDFKKNYGFAPRKTDIGTLGQPQATTNEEKGLDSFPKAMLSHSMIQTNATGNRRVPMGKLDSMARKVDTAFKDDAKDRKMPEVTAPSTDNTHQSFVAHRSSFPQKMPSTFTTLDKQTSDPVQTIEPKKRRESVDLGIGLERRHSAEALPFMRRMKAEQSKVEQNQEESQVGKGFQFWKKRKEAQQQQQHLTLGTGNGTQSMKQINNFSAMNGGFKKPQFLNTPNKLSIPSYNMNSPEEKTLEGSSTPVTPLTNFEFKKKKFMESSAQPLNAKPVASTKDNQTAKGQFLTMKERMAMKRQRQIKLDDFEMLEKLGKGAFGDVYIAQQKKIGFVCVIKKMSKKRIRDAKVEEHILREIKIQSCLNHKNLTSLFGYFHDEDNLYLILEALPDGSLQNVKKKKKLPERQAAAIVRQVVEGLRHMHEQYIIHRDLKPENLFVNETTVKIGDFGCSIYNRDLGLRNTVVGCLQYSSPEQLSQGGYSQKIDSWSLGILTYELLFGKSPYGNDLIKLAQNKQIEPKLSNLTFPPGIPIKEETRKFIENLLEADPDKRMDMDEVLHHDFLKEEMAKKQQTIEDM